MHTGENDITRARAQHLALFSLYSAAHNSRWLLLSKVGFGREARFWPGHARQRGAAQNVDRRLRHQGNSAKFNPLAVLSLCREAALNEVVKLRDGDGFGNSCKYRLVSSGDPNGYRREFINSQNSAEPAKMGKAVRVAPAPITAARGLCSRRQRFLGSIPVAVMAIYFEYQLGRRFAPLDFFTAEWTLILLGMLLLSVVLFAACFAFIRSGKFLLRRLLR